jgi:hypothetical protein
LPLKCAQEILSLFLLGVASKVQSVGGNTWRAAGSVSDGQKDSEPREWLNSTFQKLARDVEIAGLAHNITEAYTLVIPAFNHYGLLPTESNE